MSLYLSDFITFKMSANLVGSFVLGSSKFDSFNHHFIAGFCLGPSLLFSSHLFGLFKKPSSHSFLIPKVEYRSIPELFLIMFLPPVDSCTDFAIKQPLSAKLRQLAQCTHKFLLTLTSGITVKAPVGHSASQAPQ